MDIKTLGSSLILLKIELRKIIHSLEQLNIEKKKKNFFSKIFLGEINDEGKIFITDENKKIINEEFKKYITNYINIYKQFLEELDEFEEKMLNLIPFDPKTNTGKYILEEYKKTKNFINLYKTLSESRKIISINLVKQFIIKKFSE
jgi:hypothetical protein